MTATLPSTHPMTPAAVGNIQGRLFIRRPREVNPLVTDPGVHDYLRHNIAHSLLTAACMYPRFQTRLESCHSRKTEGRTTPTGCTDSEVGRAVARLPRPLRRTTAAPSFLRAKVTANSFIDWHVERVVGRSRRPRCCRAAERSPPTTRKSSPAPPCLLFRRNGATRRLFRAWTEPIPYILA